MHNSELILDYSNSSQKEIYKRVKEQLKKSSPKNELNIVKKKLNFDII